MNKLFTFIVLWMMSCLPTLAQAPMDGGVWKDNTGKHTDKYPRGQTEFLLFFHAFPSPIRNCR